MKAFFVYSMTGGGAERVVSLLANEIALNEKVLLITISSQPSHYRLHSNVIQVSLNHRGKSRNALLGLFKNIEYLFQLSVLIKRHKVSRLICFMPTANLLGVVVGMLRGVHVTVSERSDPLVYNYGVRGIIRKYLYRYADKLVVQTDFIREYFSAYMLNSKIELIANPVNLVDVPKNEKKNIILSVGRLDENKNQRLLIEAFALLKRKDWRLVICGDGECREDLESLIVERNLAETVELTGFVSNISDYYSEARIFSFASKSEGFPNVILEAMAHGCACVSTKCVKGGHQLLQDNTTCLLVPSGEIEEFAFQLNKLISSPQLRKELIEKSKLMIQSYSTDEIVKKWIM